MQSYYENFVQCNFQLHHLTKELQCGSLARKHHIHSIYTPSCTSSSSSPSADHVCLIIAHHSHLCRLHWPLLTDVEYGRWIRLDRLEVSSKNLGRMLVMKTNNQPYHSRRFYYSPLTQICKEGIVETKELSPGIAPMPLLVFCLSLCVVSDQKLLEIKYEK